MSGGLYSRSDQSCHADAGPRSHRPQLDVSGASSFCWGFNEALGCLWRDMAGLGQNRRAEMLKMLSFTVFVLSSARRTSLEAAMSGQGYPGRVHGAGGSRVVAADLSRDGWGQRRQLGNFACAYHESRAQRCKSRHQDLRPNSGLKRFITFQARDSAHAVDDVNPA